MSNSVRPHGLQHAGLPCPSLSPGVCSNSCPLSWWCYPTISSSVTPFSSCPWSFPASGSFPVSRLFTSGGQSIGALASASVLPMNIQSWFPLGLTGLILPFKGLSTVFSSTTVRKHQLFSAQPSFWSNSDMKIWQILPGVPGAASPWENHKNGTIYCHRCQGNRDGPRLAEDWSESGVWIR